MAPRQTRICDKYMDDILCFIREGEEWSMCMESSSVTLRVSMGQVRTTHECKRPSPALDVDDSEKWWIKYTLRTRTPANDFKRASWKERKRHREGRGVREQERMDETSTCLILRTQCCRPALGCRLKISQPWLEPVDPRSCRCSPILVVLTIPRA